MSFVSLKVLVLSFQSLVPMDEQDCMAIYGPKLVAASTGLIRWQIFDTTDFFHKKITKLFLMELFLFFLE